jgi:hypothetical protein
MEGFFVTLLFLVATTFDLDASPGGKPSDIDTLAGSFFTVFVLPCSHMKYHVSFSNKQAFNASLDIWKTAVAFSY